MTTPLPSDVKPSEWVTVALLDFYPRARRGNSPTLVKYFFFMFLFFNYTVKYLKRVNQLLYGALEPESPVCQEQRGRATEETGPDAALMEPASLHGADTDKHPQHGWRAWLGYCPSLLAPLLTTALAIRIHPTSQANWQT